jgi:hypothetical protein
MQRIEPHGNTPNRGGFLLIRSPIIRPTCFENPDPRTFVR